jgi:hypothetical protein
MGRPPRRPTVDQLLRLIDRTEADLRTIIARWDGLPLPARAALATFRAAVLVQANRLLRTLVSAGRR